MKNKTTENISGAVFISPVILGIIVFSLIPILLSFYYSFTKFDNITAPEFIYFENYKKLFADEEVWHSLKVTFTYAVITVVLSMILSFMIGLLMNIKLKGIKLFRVLIYSPVIIPGVAMAAIWRDTFNPTYIGLANRFLAIFNIDACRWFASEKTALATLMILCFWGIGGGMMMWLAGLNGINKTYYEAATLDGANRLQKMTKITLPMISPIIFYNLVMNIIGSLQIFSQAFLISGKGPYNSTNFIALYIYETGIGELNMGYACAMAWILFAIILIFVIIVFKTSGWVFYGDEVEKK